MSKTCTGCGERKAVDQFYKGRGKCKVCIAAYMKQYNADNKEAFAARKQQYQKQYNADNREAMSIGMIDVALSKSIDNVSFMGEFSFGPRSFKSIPAFDPDGDGEGPNVFIQNLYVTYGLTDKLSLTAGYMGTFVVYEVISPAGNFNYSTSYLFTNGPFQNAGIKADYAFSDKLTLSGNYSYTDTEYGEDYLISNLDDPSIPAAIWGEFTQVDTVDYVAVGSDADLFTFNLKGNQLKGIPQEKFTLRAEYEMDSGIGPIWMNISHSYTGSFSASGIERAYDRVPSREVTNLSFSWFSEDGDTSA